MAVILIGATAANLTAIDSIARMEKQTYWLAELEKFRMKVNAKKDAVGVHLCKLCDRIVKWPL
jgi:hypothetical protein